MGDFSEIQEAKNWIYDKLSANADITAVVGTRIFADHYPGTRVFPYVLYNTMSDTDLKGVGRNRIANDALFQVRCVCQGAPSADAKKVGKRIDDVLQNQANQLSGEFYFSSERAGEVDRPEFDATNTRYHNLGGLYRVWIAKIP